MNSAMKSHTATPLNNVSMRIFLFLFFMASGLIGHAQSDDCYPPKPDKLVTDMVGILSPTEQNALESKLRKLNTETSNQVVIVVIAELCAGDAAMTAYEIGERWQVGQEAFDNGVVILVKPTGGPGERHTFIAPGYGLEGAIPDATAKLIVDREMIPAFKSNNFYAGLDRAVDIISDLAREEYSYKEYQEKSSADGKLVFIPFLIFILVWFLLFYNRTKSYASSNNVGFWAALALMSATSRSHSGRYSSFRSGGGGFGGGGGGGGFGGFGGGSFGGGGAGGSW